MRILVLAVTLLFGGAARGEAFSWEAQGEYDEAMQRADALLARAAKASRHAEALVEPEVQAERRRKLRAARRLVLEAADAYEKAAAMAPERAEPHFRAAEGLYAVLIDGHEGAIRDEHPALRAIEHWKRFIELAPDDPRIEDVLFRRSITRTKLGGTARYRAGLEDYRAELRLVDPEDAWHMALILSNTAELLMALGELDSAIEHYEQALDLKPHDALYGYGLAVALDRDGQKQRAYEVMLRYVSAASRDRFPALSRNNVFFIPEGDIEYYRALGYEALGQWRAAASHYRMYLTYQGGSRYAARAKQNLKLVEAKARGEKPDKKRRRRWRDRDRWGGPDSSDGLEPTFEPTID